MSAWRRARGFSLRAFSSRSPNVEPLSPTLPATAAGKTCGPSPPLRSHPGHDATPARKSRQSIARVRRGGDKSALIPHLSFAHALKWQAKFCASPIWVRPVSSGFSVNLKHKARGLLRGPSLSDERLALLGRQRLVDQLLRLAAQVDRARAGIAAALDHADEADVVDRVGPVPGAVNAEPVERTDRRR